MDPLAVMTETLALLDAGDVDGCVARLSPDFRMNLAGAPAPMHGPELWRGNIAYALSAFPDLRTHVDDAFASGDRVTMMVRLSGTHRGEFLGIPATGRRVEWTSFEVYRVRDGLITEEWICSDLLAVVQQLS